MLENLQPLNTLPMDIHRDWLAQLRPAPPCRNGSFHLVKIRRTDPVSFEGQRIIVLVVDENGFPLSSVKVAFSYSTAHPYQVGDDFQWLPPPPYRADIFPTEGSGQIEHVQGSVVKQGEPGGVTVYVVEPDYSSDYVTGAGMLADHTGLHLTFQLRRTGIVPLGERLDQIEARLKDLESFAGI